MSSRLACTAPQSLVGGGEMARRATGQNPEAASDHRRRADLTGLVCGVDRAGMRRARGHARNGRARNGRARRGRAGTGRSWIGLRRARVARQRRHAYPCHCGHLDHHDPGPVRSQHRDERCGRHDQRHADVERGVEPRPAPPGHAQWPACRQGQEGEGAGGAEEQAAAADVHRGLGQGARHHVLEELMRDERDRPPVGRLPAARIGAGGAGGDRSATPKLRTACRCPWRLRCHPGPRCRLRHRRRRPSCPRRGPS